MNLTEKIEVFYVLQYKTENYVVLTQHFLFLWAYKKLQRYLQRKHPVSNYQTGFMQLILSMETVEVGKSFFKMPKRKQAEEEAREGEEQITDNRELLDME